MDLLVEISGCPDSTGRGVEVDELHAAGGGDGLHRDHIYSMMPRWQCIRTSTHKYIANWNDIDEFYDLTEDPDELQNLGPCDSPELNRLKMLLLRNQSGLFAT